MSNSRQDPTPKTFRFQNYQIKTISVFETERQVHKRKRVNRYREEPHLLKKNSKIEFIEVRY